MEVVLLFFSSPSLPSLVTNFASPKGIEIKTKWLSQAACRRHKLRNFCARLNHFLGVYGKNEDCHLLRFSVLFVMVYFVFSVNKFFMEKIPKQNRLFWLFFKKVKTGDFVSRFYPWKMHRQKKQSTPRRRGQKNE